MDYVTKAASVANKIYLCTVFFFLKLVDMDNMIIFLK